MLTRQNIIDYCNQYHFDIRVSGNGRWIDQKCAIDVVSVIADCILNYDLEHTNEFFTTPDIWHYRYAVENVQDIFFASPNICVLFCFTRRKERFI